MTRILCLTVFLLAMSSPYAKADMWVLSGGMDALQAGTNGGFGAFDGGIAGAGNGTGNISGTYDDATDLLSYNITFSNLTSPVTIAHFHLGAPGVSGGVELDIGGTSSPMAATNVLLNTQALEDNLLAGNWYVNIHTNNFAAGEIRGQVNVTAVPEPTGLGLLALGATGVVATRRRRR